MAAPLNTTAVESSSPNNTATDAPDAPDSNTDMDEAAPDADNMEINNNMDEEFVDHYIKTYMDDSPEEDIQDDAQDADDISGGKTSPQMVHIFEHLYSSLCIFP